MSPGPNESDELVTFELTTDNDALFERSRQLLTTARSPINPPRTHSAWPRSRSGLVDNGGTDNGGQDTSAAQTFTTTVTPVNHPPTLDDIADITIGENSPETLALSGIPSVRSYRQSIASVTAVSGNPALVPDPIVELNGGIRDPKFTPTSNKAGTSGDFADSDRRWRHCWRRYPTQSTKTFNIDVGFRPVLDTDPIPVIAAIPRRGKCSLPAAPFPN